MEHLPSYGASPPIEVPYVCTSMYDGGIFTDYPTRMGWNKEALLHGELQDRTTEETASFLQSWMYFGLLFEVFNVPEARLDASSFIRTTADGRRVVTTGDLKQLAISWYQRESGRTPEGKLQRWTQLNTCFAELWKFVSRYCTQDSYLYYKPPTFWPLSPEISLSVMVLADSVMKAGYHITGKGFNHNWGISKLLVNRMEEGGWCENVISILTTSQQVHMLYYASTFGRFVGRSHENCSRFVCKADQVNESNYETLHTPGHGDCPFVGPDVEQVKEILRKGNIPLVVVQEVDSKVLVDVVEHKSSVLKEYVAIPHIWADGTGNPKENTLPICQLRHLQSLVNGLQELNIQRSGPCLWWCDTLCVPIEQSQKIRERETGENGEDGHQRKSKDTRLEKARGYRKLAIRRMRQTYQDATKVLVPDSSIRQNSKTAPQLDAATLDTPRGVLAKEVFIQFADGALDIRTIKTRMGSLGFTSLYTRYDLDAYAVLGPFSNPTNNPQPSQFTAFWRQLQYRSTSDLADETICLATLLNIDPGPLLSIPASHLEQRLIKFYQLIHHLPGILLFQPATPRLTAHRGFRWAPSSLLACFRGSTTNPYLVNFTPAFLGPEQRGLEISLPGLILEPKVPLTIGTDFLLRIHGDAKESLFRVTYVQPERAARNFDGTRNLYQPALILGKSLSLIEESSVRARVVECVLVDLGGGFGERDAYVQGEGGKGGLEAVFVAALGVEKVVDARFTSGFEVREDLREVLARELDKGTRWIVE